MNSTKIRILETAERLFATNGISATTLRDLTSEAQVNLAAVNYHFGNRKKLIHEVFRRRLDKLNKERLQGLEQLKSSKDPIDLESVLAVLIGPALVMSRDDSQGGSRFVKVLARAYAENDNDLHAFLSEHYGHVIKQFASTLLEIMPGINEAELRWQLDFIIGALTYVMADFGNHYSSGNAFGRANGLDSDMKPELITQRLVAFAAAGIRGVIQDVSEVHQRALYSL